MSVMLTRYLTVHCGSHTQLAPSLMHKFKYKQNVVWSQKHIRWAKFTLIVESASASHR